MTLEEYYMAFFNSRSYSAKNYLESPENFNHGFTEYKNRWLKRMKWIPISVLENGPDDLAANWCEENCIGHFSFDEVMNWFFEFETDALLFKLTWL